MLSSAAGSLAHHLDLPSVEHLVRNLQDCRDKKDLPLTRHLHSLIHHSGLQALDVIASHLVPAFATCGSITDAQQAFHQLEQPDEHSWTSLIQSYIESGNFEDALELFHCMQRDGVTPSKHTYLPLVKLCARIKHVQKGYELHTHIILGGLEADEFLSNSLVDMYAKCGFLLDARRVFDGLPLQTVVSWNILITGYAGCDLGEEALNCFEQMQLKGIVSNDITFLSTLKACGSLHAIEEAQEIHAEIAKEGYEDDYFIGSSLLDVYAKCGILVEAQELFDELPVHDVVSWTALIAGYADHGHGEQALYLIDRMQVEGVVPNIVTFLCGLKSSGTIGAVDRGYDFHGEIAKEGLSRDFAIGSSLIDMYSKFGLLTEAEDVFYELPSKDVVLWTTLIAGFAEHGYDEEATKLLQMMQLEEVFPDAIALVCALKACASSGNLSFGQEVHVEIAKEGAESESFVANTLVDMYAKCGSLVEAQEVFDELQVHDVVSWSALIAGYTELKFDEEALDCFADMQQEGVIPDAFTFVSALKACANLGALERGQKIFLQIVEEDLERDYFIGNIVVGMYAKCGSLVDAEEVFDNLRVRNVVSWNALILGFSEHGPATKALDFFDQMRLEGVASDVVTYVCILKACAMSEAIWRCHEFHAEIVKWGFDSDLLVGNTLVDMYMKSGALLEVSTLFDNLPDRDIVSWNTLIAGFTDQGLDEEALQCLGDMYAEGFSLDTTTCVSSLKACGNLGAVNDGLEIHDEIVREGFDTILAVGNAIINFYVECALLEEAQDVFDTLNAIGDAISWSSLIMGYSEQEDGFEKAFLLYKQMQEQGFLPNNLSFISILKACGNSTALELVRGIDAQIRQCGGSDITEAKLATAVVNAYAKCGCMVDAQQLADEMSARDLAGWNALITGYVRKGEAHQVFRMFKLMTDEGVEPDAITFICLISACCHAGLVELGEFYFEAMSREYAILPTRKHETCMMDLLGRSGQLNEAAKVLEMLPFEDDLVPWSSMMGACRKWGYMDLGKQAFEQAVELGDKSSASFSLMVNMYTDFEVLSGRELESFAVFKQTELSM